MTIPNNAIYIYDEGDGSENLEIISTPGDWSISINSVIEVRHPFEENSNPAILSTDGKIDFTNISTLYFDWDLISGATDKNVEVHISETNSGTDSEDDVLSESYVFSDGRKVDSLDVSNISGEYYIKLSFWKNTSGGFNAEMDVFKIAYLTTNSIKGTVRLDGTATENVTIRCIRQSDNTIVDTTTSDSNGEYEFDGLDDTETYHIGFVEYSTYESEETFTFEGASESDSKYTRTLDEGTYEVEVHGADGGDYITPGEGVSGGYIKGKFDASQGDEIEIWVGQTALSETTTHEVGGWGRFSGGDGGTPATDPGAGGGGSTEVLLKTGGETGNSDEDYNNTEIIAVADGGGGDAYPDSGGGGGGARCGQGGQGESSYDGEDAGCPSNGIGFGGDGGNYTDDDTSGSPGGQEAGSMLYDVTEITGGATEDSNGNGYVILRKIDKLYTAKTLYDITPK